MRLNFAAAAQASNFGLFTMNRGRKQFNQLGNGKMPFSTLPDLSKEAEENKKTEEAEIEVEEQEDFR